MLVVAFMFATAPTSTQRLQLFFERACNVCAYFYVICDNFAFYLLSIFLSHVVSCGSRLLKLLEIPLWRGPSSKRLSTIGKDTSRSSHGLLGQGTGAFKTIRGVPASNLPSGHAGLDGAQLVGFLASLIGSPREKQACEVRGTKLRVGCDLSLAKWFFMCYPRHLMLRLIRVCLHHVCLALYVTQRPALPLYQMANTLAHLRNSKLSTHYENF
jgi:hypothetical protein